MSTCINRSHPEFKSLVNSIGYSENEIAALVSLWQNNNPVERDADGQPRFPTSQELENYIASVRTNEFPKMSDPYFKFISQSLKANWSGPTGDNVSGLLNRFKRSLGVDTAGSEVVLPEEALKHLLYTAEAGVVTNETLTQAIEALNTYLGYSASYMQGIANNLSNFLSKDLTSRQKVSALFFAFEIANNYKKQLEAIFPSNSDSSFAEMSGFFKDPAYTFLMDNVEKIRKYVGEIERSYDSKLKNEVVDILYDYLKPNTAEVDEIFDKEIRRYDEAIQATKDPKIIRTLQNLKRTQEEKKKEQRISKENVRKWLSDPRGAGVFNYFRSSKDMKDPAVQNIASYIFSILEDGKQEFYQEVNELQTIQERIEKEANKTVDFRIDVRKIYRPYYRETVDQNGNFALAIQTPMKEQELLNKYIQLTKALEAAATEEEKDVLEEELENFMETYVERRYVDAVYQYRKMLPKELKNKMNRLRAERTNILEDLDPLKIEEGDLIKLREIDKQIYNLQKEYTEDGVLKTGQELLDAQLIKAYNQKAEELGIHSFYITPASRRNFEIAYQEQTEKNKAIQESDATAEEKEAAQQQYNNWLSVYTRTVINPRFYSYRNEITAEIDEILSKYEKSTIGDLYRDLFSLLAGYRDKNGAYDGSIASQQLVARTKEVEEQIESLRQTSKNKNISREDKDRLSELFTKLKNIQVTAPTEYYLDEVERQKNIIKSKLEAAQDWDPTVLQEQVDKLYERSEWFYNNHIKVTRYVDGKKTESWEPLSIWKFTMPSQLAESELVNQVVQEIKSLQAQNDPSLQEEIDKLKKFKVIDRIAPSKIWFSYGVNKKYENPNYSPDLKFKTVQGAYYNEEWDKLTPEQKSIATDLLALYRRSQEKNYKSNRLNTLVPFVRRDGTERLYDALARTAPEKTSEGVKKVLRGGLFKNLKSSLKAMWHREDLQDAEVDDVYGDVNQVDVFGNPLNKTSRAIYMRYTKPLDKDVLSFDITKSIGLYMGEAARFRSLREHQSEILAMQSVLDKASGLADVKSTPLYQKAFRVTKDQAVSWFKKKDSPERKKALQEKAVRQRYEASQNIHGLINRLLYGENIKKLNSEFLTSIQSVLNHGLQIVGRMSIEQNPRSTVKNLVAGMVSNLINAGIYDISEKDLIAAQVDGFRAAKAFFLNPQVGNRPYNLRLMDYFGVIMGREFAEGKNIKSTFMRKHGNPLKGVHRLREITEYELQTSMAYAILNKQYVQTEDGLNVKLTEAFEIVDNKLVPKEGVIIPEGMINRIRTKIKQALHTSQGIYDQLYQPEGSKYVTYRVALYMGKWVMPKADRLFGEEKINYGAAIRTQGSYNVMFTWLKQLISEQNNIAASYKYASTSERKAIRSLMTQAVVSATLIILQRLIKHCDDDGRQDACDELNYLIKGVANEVESLDPVLWTPSFVYGFVDQKTDKSWIEKGFYSLSSPLIRLNQTFKEIFTAILDPFEPYYKYTSSGKKNWNVTDPTLAGLPAAAVIALKYTGLNQLDVSYRAGEFKSRQLSYYNPKLYMADMPTKTRYISKSGKVAKIKKRKKKKVKKQR